MKTLSPLCTIQLDLIHSLSISLSISFISNSLQASQPASTCPCTRWVSVKPQLGENLWAIEEPQLVDTSQLVEALNYVCWGEISTGERASTRMVNIRSLIFHRSWKFNIGWFAFQSSELWKFSTDANCCQSLPSDQSSELRVYLVKLQFDHADRRKKSPFLENAKSIGCAGRCCFHPFPLSSEKPRCILFRFKRIRMLHQSDTVSNIPSVNLVILHSLFVLIIDSPSDVPLSSLKYSVAQSCRRNWVSVGKNTIWDGGSTAP